MKLTADHWIGIIASVILFLLPVLFVVIQKGCGQ